jgi:hypothetical protein
MPRYLWFSILIPSLLIGCSSTPNVEVVQDQYCNTSSKTELSNGVEVNSNVIVECSDDPFKRAKLVGIDEQNCRRWQREDVINGRIKTYGGYICRDEKGVWRPLSHF